MKKHSSPASDGIPADVRYAVGAVGRKQDGSAYTLRVDII